MTNYEKIKSMSVDEMALNLRATVSNSNCQIACELCCNNNCTAVDTLYKKSYEICEEKIKQWLESETEPNFCTDKQNKLVHCENCHEECKFDKFE